VLTTGCVKNNHAGQRSNGHQLESIVFVNDQAAIDSVRAGFRPNDIREDPKLNPQIGVIKDLDDSTRQLVWRFRADTFAVSFTKDSRLNEAYTKLRLGKVNFEPYLISLPGDTNIVSLARQLTRLAKDKNYDDDRLIELAASFIQAIPYDEAKVKKFEVSKQLSYYTPYQVLYQGAGICLDKALLGIAIYRELGVGAALFLYPRPINWATDKVGHAAIGLQCPAGSGLYVGENYCYLETTSDIPIGIIPEISDQGFRITNPNNRSDARSLGPVEIKLSTQGKSYRGTARQTNGPI